MIIRMYSTITFLQEVVELSFIYFIFLNLYLSVFCTVTVNCDPWNDQRCGKQGFGSYFVYFNICFLKYLFKNAQCIY